MPEEEQPIEDIRYDSYADVFTINWKKGIIRLSFGQGVHKPPRMHVHIYMSLPDLEALQRMLSDSLPAIRKVHETQ
jgi:hypothetical protein